MDQNKLTDDKLDLDLDTRDDENSQVLDELLSKLDDVDLPPGFRTSWQDKISQTRQRDRFLNRRRRLATWALTATAVGLIAVFVPSFNRGSDQALDENLFKDTAQEEMAADISLEEESQIRSFTLPQEEASNQVNDALEASDNTLAPGAADPSDESLSSSSFSSSSPSSEALIEAGIEADLIIEIDPAYQEELQDYLRKNELKLEDAMWMDKAQYEALVQTFREEGWLIKASPWPQDKDQTQAVYLFLA